MRNYTVKISRKAQRDVEELSDFLLTVISVEGARRYLDTMIAEVMSLAVFADLYRPSPMADIRQYHPMARRMGFRLLSVLRRKPNHRRAD